MATPKQRWAAFEEVICQNEDDLSRYFQRRILNGADAAEAFGEFLLTAWKQRRKMPVDATEARMWLFVIARNVMLSSRRKSARHSKAVQRFADEMRLVDATLPSADEAAQLREAIAGLPAEDAELLKLVYGDGLRSHEAGAVLGINASTARSRIARAKRELRAALSDSSVEESEHDLSGEA